MDFTVDWVCPGCKHKYLKGHGGNFGGRITMVKMKCPECDLTILVIPMGEGEEYTVSAKTEKETTEYRHKKVKIKKLEEEALKLRREISLD